MPPLLVLVLVGCATSPSTGDIVGLTFLSGFSSSEVPMILLSNMGVGKMQ